MGEREERGGKRVREGSKEGGREARKKRRVTDLDGGRLIIRG